MTKIYQVTLRGPNGEDGGATATLELPATPYQLLDALDRLRLTSPNDAAVEVNSYGAFPQTSASIPDNADLLQLNALAERLASLDAGQRTAFLGLLRIEEAKSEQPLPLSRLLDIAEHTENCFVADAATDEALGRFYCDNGFIDPVNSVPDDAYELLDFAKVGRQMREAEGGVFSQGRYVVQNEDIPWRDRDIRLEKPEYIIQGTIRHINTDVPAEITFPISGAELRNRLAQVGADSWRMVIFQCGDCAVPGLERQIECADNPESINRFANSLKMLENRELAKYKALITLVPRGDLDSAAELLESLDEYVLDRDTPSPQDAAKGFLRDRLGISEAELLEKYLDLNSYGKEIMDIRNEISTEYGSLSRQDGLPVLVPDDGQEQTGMEIQF